MNFEYSAEANERLTQAMKKEKASGTWDEKLRWEYEWNPRDQMERANLLSSGNSNGIHGKMDSR